MYIRQDVKHNYLHAYVLISWFSKGEIIETNENKWQYYNEKGLEMVLI
jgi:hypothetical protein